MTNTTRNFFVCICHHVSFGISAIKLRSYKIINTQAAFLYCCVSDLDAASVDSIDGMIWNIHDTDMDSRALRNWSPR